ncbi:MAG: alpha-L-fucosidase [Bacteroidetes bacterium]|nr:alpha-L-fucosidase [Bacteroidota bacterium]
MKNRFLFIFIFFYTAGLLSTSAQNGVNLPDASGKLPFLSPRDQQAPTQVPDPLSLRSDQPDRMEWWRDARFGMFIHWGLYAVPAGEWKGKTGYGEWIRTSAEIPLEVYDQFRPKFNPVQFDADAWVRMARDAGMKYIVITSKHHDGFCMFDTKLTDFNIMSTPFKHDPMTELAAACKKYGLKFCFYHSIMDWHHPDYLPRREWEKDRTAEGADFSRYVAYMKAQLKELLSHYGDIGVLWFDGEWESTWNEKYGKEIYNYVKSIQPGILVNNRVGAGRLDMEGLTAEGAFGGDFGTPEQQIPATGLPGVDWETCMTMNDHWGYNSADKNFKPAGEIIRMLADIASKGGNYLLNVGPTAEGLFPPESISRLDAIGKWMKVNGESIYGTGASPFSQLKWGRCTKKLTATGAILYLHVFDWPANGKLVLSGVLNTPGKAYLLADPGRSPLTVTRKSDALVITLPPKAPDPVNSVIALNIQGKPDLTDPPEFKTGFDTFTDSLFVSLASDRDRVEIRYNIGKSEPAITSALYSNPILVKATSVISARCFRDGKPVSGTVSKEFTKATPLQAATPPPAGVAPGLHYRYFEGSWDSLPDFNTLKPAGEGIIPDFQFTPRTRDDLFGFVYDGYVMLPETSVCIFYTGSDDGSRLWIDDVPVVNNDGLHGLTEKSGSIALAGGLHKIRVGFFERTGSDNLAVFVKSQKMEKMVIPKEWLCH